MKNVSSPLIWHYEKTDISTRLFLQSLYGLLKFKCIYFKSKDGQRQASSLFATLFNTKKKNVIQRVRKIFCNIYKYGAVDEIIGLKWLARLRGKNFDQRSIELTVDGQIVTLIENNLLRQTPHVTPAQSNKFIYKKIYASKRCLWISFKKPYKLLFQFDAIFKYLRWTTFQKKKRMDQSNSFLIDPEIRLYTIELCYRLYISGNN